MSAFTVSYVTFLYLFLMPVCRNLTKIPVPEMSAFAGSCVTFSYLFLVPVCQKFQLLTKATFLKQGTVHLDKFSSDRYLDDSGFSSFLKYLENKNFLFLDEFYLFLHLYSSILSSLLQSMHKLFDGFDLYCCYDFVTPLRLSRSDFSAFV